MRIGARLQEDREGDLVAADRSRRLADLGGGGHHPQPAVARRGDAEPQRRRPQQRRRPPTAPGVTDQAVASRQAEAASLGAARRAAPVEVEPRVVDLEAQLRRQPLGDRRDVGLVDLLDAAAARARDVVVVSREAGDVGVDMAVQLQAPRHTGVDERLQRAEDGCPADPRLLPPKAPVELLGGQLPSRSGQRVGDQQSLARHPFTGRGRADQPPPGWCDP